MMEFASFVLGTLIITLGVWLGVLFERRRSARRESVPLADAVNWSYFFPIICPGCLKSHFAIMPGRDGGYVDTVVCLLCGHQFPLAANVILAQGVTPYNQAGDVEVPGLRVVGQGQQHE